VGLNYNHKVRWFPTLSLFDVDKLLLKDLYRCEAEAKEMARERVSDKWTTEIDRMV
jgi:hypothetical protein